MTAEPLEVAAHATIEGYLRAVATRLTGPARARQAILAELRDGLLEAAGTHLALGRTPVEAADAAIGEFGDPASIASGFSPELAASTARRVALTLGSTGPFIGLLWLGAYAAGRFGPVEAAPPWRWPGAPTGAWLAFPLIGAAVATAVLATLLVLVSTGRLSRLLPTRRGAAPIAAATVGVAAITVDLTMLGLLAIQVTTQPDSLAWAPLAVAVAATLARLLVASRCTRRCQAIRASIL